MTPLSITIGIIILTNLQINIHGDKSEKFNCGKRLVKQEALIVNGNKSREGDWPWHTSILHVEINQNIQYKCGGTLLNSNSILTAAHCVYENGRPIVPDRVLIQLGRYNLKISGPHSQEIEAYQIYVHDNYNITSLSNDIAIVRLATEATLNNFVQPICLWDSNKNDLSEVVGKHGTVVGFGLTEQNKISYNLREAVIPVVSLTTCLESDRNFYGSFLSDYTFCAGNRNGTTACNGDSGGSLTFEENGVYRIRGIVSLTQVRPGNHNRFCNTDHYVLFTDVAKYVNWIREVVPSLPSPSAELTTDRVSSSSINYCYFLNNDLTNARTQRDDCAERCASTPHCTHFTWTNYNGGSCWMKRSSVTASDAHYSEDKLAVCGVVDNMSHISWNETGSAFGCDFPEHDLANVKTSDNDCYNECTSTEGCTHFTWKAGTCWMKRGSVGQNDAFVSNDKSSICGITKKIAWNGNKWAVGCDFRGNDVNNVRSKNEDCFAHCAFDSLCTHFSWNNAFGGTCWMKQYNGVNKSDAVLALDAPSVCGLI